MSASRVTEALPRSATRLVDGFGRTAEDLRISLTDKCSLRCTYCMPEEGLQWLSRRVVLTDEEILRLAGVFLRLGIRSIRLTGGEPLVRPGVTRLVAGLAALSPCLEISLTTNAITLADHARELARAGLQRVNVSLDTLDRQRFAELTRRDRLPDVLMGLQAAAEAGLNPVKVNAVLMRGVSLEEGAALLEWSLLSGYELRFIEHMPLDAQHAWQREQMVTAAEILDVLAGSFELRPIGSRGSAPAEEFDIVDGPRRTEWAGRQHRVGIIASVTQPFCRECDRLRLTADGQLRTCLFSHVETDLREALRGGASDGEMEELIRTAVLAKPAGHAISSPQFRQPARSMSAIGG
jgi:GTP 3',8-cyclase